MRFDQPPRPSPSLVPSPERVAAFTAELRARAEKEMAAALGRTTKPAAVPQLLARPNIKYAATDWVWPDRIARGKLTLLGGAPGIGKSTFAMNVIARVTAGDAWPCAKGWRRGAPCC
jgi:predicted ATP-dependent serine protease